VDLWPFFTKKLKESAMRLVDSLRQIAYLSMGCLVLGCEQTSQSRAYSTDPLLQFWKPVEGKVKDAPPIVLAYAEPEMPTLANSTAYADKHGGDEGSQPVRAKLDFEPASKTTLEAQLVGRTKVGTSEDLFGHAEDFRWLIGRLVKDSDGKLVLRYMPDWESGSLEGTVSLDQKLAASYQAGDVVFVEGEISTFDPIGSSSAHHVPLYKVRSIKLLKKAS
jgi:hypothetical protein